MIDQRDLQRRMGQTEVAERTLSGAGTAFPSSPPTSMRFFRTDLGYDCYYDGTRWLTISEYSLVITAQVSSAVAFDAAFVVPRDDGYRAYWTYAAVQTFISPTNTIANYWTIELQSVDNAIASTTTIASFNTSALAAGGNYTALGITTALPTNRPLTRAHVTKTGAPSSIALTMTAYYRLVIT
jgi:hypothetical protein